MALKQAYDVQRIFLAPCRSTTPRKTGAGSSNLIRLRKMSRPEKRLESGTEPPAGSREDRHGLQGQVRGRGREEYHKLQDRVKGLDDAEIYDKQGIEPLSPGAPMR